MTLIPKRKQIKVTSVKVKKTNTSIIGQTFNDLEIISMVKDSKFYKFSDYNVKCNKCGKEYVKAYQNIVRSHSVGCKCSFDYTTKHFINLSNSSARSRVDKTNTTGYKGVCPYVIHKSRFLKGYQAIIFHNKRIIMRNRIMIDDTNGDKLKAILVCAIDRDLFIREKDLPHFKNFTDEELTELIEDDFYYQIKRRSVK